jgi:hypothetical protein
MVRPRSTILAAVLVLAGASTAFAASLAVTGQSLGAATIDAPRCTTAGLSILQNLSAATVISVTVGSLTAGCGNATLAATVNNLVTSSGGSATVPSGGGSVTVTPAVAVAITAAEEIDLVLTGP